MRVLVVNAGSSTVKLSLIDERERTLASVQLQASRARVDPDALQAALRSGLADAQVVAHRIVHGGERFHQAVLVDAGIERELQSLTALAPLHQPKSLAALRAVSSELPDVPAIACFDTAFHATLPPAAATYALPRRWRERWGLRRYGFHGLSHAWIARRVPELLGAQANRDVRIVSCHLGAGASLCAIHGGASLDTTMGFTPLEGLVMATRSGSVDPGLLMWLLERELLSARELAEALEHESGLTGLAGSADMRQILERSARGEADAVLALEVYTHRLRAGIASMAAAIGGLDVLVYTGGVGEHASQIRAWAADGLHFLGVHLDRARNGAATADEEISAPGASVRTFVVNAREDLEMVRQVRLVLGERAQ